MKKSLPLLLYCSIVVVSLLASPLLYAQQKSVTGIITDTSGQVLQGATLSLLDENGLVIYYTFSNRGGYFRLPLSDSSIWLSVSYIGYGRQQLKLDNTTTTYHVYLVPEASVLEDVIVKNRPAATMNGDTLSYPVRNFSTDEDRSVGDVLRRLPGVEVDEDGTIYFNGKKIENLYIDGDDLMSGRYGLASKVIKKELIKSIDIIQHHQPIAVLKDKVFTDNVAVNLVLENENSLKLSATSRAGIGYPAQAEASIAPVLLSKKIKLLGFAGYNNAGIDYKAAIQQIGAADFIDDVSTQTKDISLSLSGISPPDIPLSYYYINRSALFSLNTIYKTKDDIRFKWNSHVFSDRSQLDYVGETLYFLPNDTITYADKQTLVNKPLRVNTALSVMINKKSYFLNNSFNLSADKDTYTGLIGFNGNGFGQLLNKQKRAFSNDFNWMPAIRGKGIAELRWFSSYGTNRQQLDIDKEYYFDVAPQEGHYDTVTQLVQSPAWFHHIYLSYKIPAKKILQEYRVGYQYLQQDLSSALSFINNNISTPYANDPGNDARWTNKRLYLLARYQLKLKKLQSDIRLPFSIQQIRLLQPLYSLDDFKRNWLFLPSLNLTYNFSQEKQLQVSYQLQHVFGDMTTAYRGAILLNYRNLQAYAQGFRQQKIHRAAINYSYQQSIRLFFSNIGVAYDYTIANTILANSFSNNIRQVVLIPYANHQWSVSAHAGLSQYLFRLKTKAGLKVEQKRTVSGQFVNNALLRFQYDYFSLTISADKHIAKLVDISYSTRLSWLNTQLADKSARQLPPASSFSFDQRFTTSFNFWKHFYIATTGSHRVNKWQTFNNTGYFFLDAQVKRTGIFKGGDMELNCYNLLNVKDYAVYSQGENQLSTSSFPTRGITFFLRVNYTF